jgi:hypothetical protein
LPYVGARAPEAIDIVIATVNGFDLTTVSSVEIVTKSPKGSTLPWTWTVASATPTELHLVHAFSDNGNDAKEDGKYVVMGWLVSPSTRRRIKPVSIQFEKYG